ncbi:MAG: signal recognition particle protein Srp54 [Candidatus Thermoplasmatota archaeon]|nr:signal recognition particle protein [Euryarchaeota archaeon]MBU4032463.1 signal recognition particle protein Srp54 [Candidatus Thermoplasmatota archaeon]MBU4071414.1 signal recognition particle protein Srp54 [Candidatus Thermoplasmatota archaeon]MBU4144457.1 signal recognition particle protein Srp54 [Candidatus Thermoplasmatota archaeon]MBU4592311.1 signal recognition particle protein Srp54 [Candidatus Thermoplasmatota archaeon]
MVMEKLGDSLKNVLRKIANASHVDQDLVKEIVRDIQRALLQADVNVQLALKITKDIESRALTEKPKAGSNPKQHVIRIVHEELVNFLGEKREIGLKNQVIMMVGLYGQGKTTTTGKLARYFKKKGQKVGLVAADVHRPAAYDQLSQIGALIEVPVFGIPGEKNAAKIVKEGMKHFSGFDVIILDTSGRHSLEKDLIDEIKAISKVANPTEKIMIVDAAMGQQAGPQAKAFHDAVGVTGVVLTKLDGSAKGGGALSAVNVTDAPVLFIGTGEHIEDLELFDPSRFISRLLGMGDIQSLLEAAEGVIDEDKAEKTMTNIMHGKFSLIEMRDQMEMLTNMGPLKKLMSMFPGAPANLPEGEMDAMQEKLRKFKIIMKSMTREELEDPKIIKSSRVKRIARGSGMRVQDVRALLAHYNTTKKQMKGLMGNRKLRKQLQKQMKDGSFSGMGM